MKQKGTNFIFSRDKDLGQCLWFDNTYQVFTDSKNGFTLLSRDDVVKFHFKVNMFINPKLIPLILSIAGDASDNVPGIKGIGYKKACKLLYEMFNNEELTNNIEHLEKLADMNDMSTKENNRTLALVKQNKEMVRRNLFLTDFELLIQNENFHRINAIKQQLKKQIQNASAYEFKSFISTFLEQPQNSFYWINKMIQDFESVRG
jgi:5'-3' exonuclease